MDQLVKHAKDRTTRLKALSLASLVTITKKILKDFCEDKKSDNSFLNGKVILNPNILIKDTITMISSIKSIDSKNIAFKVIDRIP